MNSKIWTSRRSVKVFAAGIAIAALSLGSAAAMSGTAAAAAAHPVALAQSAPQAGSVCCTDGPPWG